MADELQVSSSTDTQATVAAVANGEDGRAPVDESSLANFEQSADGKVVSFENPQSERQSLLERLAEAEAEVELPVESYKEGQPVDESTIGIDMAAVREAATRDAIEDARRMHRQAYYQQQTEQHFSSQAELESVRGQLAADFGRRMDAIKPPDMDQLMAGAGQEGTDVSPAVADALLTLDGGPQATIFLLQHPEERRRLARLPEHAAVAAAAHLMARLASPPRRAISSAPPSIVPVSGSPTRSSVPADEMSYKDYSAWRDRQIKSKYRR